MGATIPLGIGATASDEAQHKGLDAMSIFEELHAPARVLAQLEQLRTCSLERINNITKVPEKILIRNKKFLKSMPTTHSFSNDHMDALSATGLYPGSHPFNPKLWCGGDFKIRVAGGDVFIQDKSSKEIGLPSKSPLDTRKATARETLDAPSTDKLREALKSSRWDRHRQRC